MVTGQIHSSPFAHIACSTFADLNMASEMSAVATHC
jgi:hypothetical protein